MSCTAAMTFPGAPLLRGALGAGRGGGSGDTGATMAGSPARSATGTAAETATGTFDELVVRHRDRVFRVALSVLGPGSDADAEDVAQEVFLRLHRSLGTRPTPGRGRFRGESRVGTWLYRVAFNLAVDLHRKRARRGTPVDEGVLVSLPTADGDPHRTARETERARQVGRLLATLPESHRAALRLHYWMGCSVAEIAELLDIAPGTVKAHLHRGREALRGALSPPREKRPVEETP